MFSITIFCTTHLKKSGLLILSFCVLICKPVGTSEPAFKASTFGREAHYPMQFRPGKDYALFFAVKDYDDPKIDDLNNPIRDAEAIAELLKKSYSFQIKIYKNPGKRQILDVLLEWQQKKDFLPKSRLFIFFTGHGTLKREFAKGYFIPKDGKWNDRFQESYIDWTTIGNIVTQIDCDHILLALDACHSGALDQKIFWKNLNNDRDIIDSLRNAPLNRLLKNKSRLFISSAKLKEVPDGTKHSPFALAFLEALKSEGGLLNYYELFSYILEHKSEYLDPHTAELPGHEGGTFVFIGNSYSTPIGQTDSTVEDTSVNKIPTPGPIQPPVELRYVLDKDSNKYAYRQLQNGQVWLVENLNLDISGSYCYENSTTNCGTYGRLYSWEASQEACKSLGRGWRLPGDKDWQNLIKQFGGCIGCSDAKSVDKKGDSYHALIDKRAGGFNAMLGGFRFFGNSKFDQLESDGYYWSSTPSAPDKAYGFQFYKHGKNIHRLPTNKQDGFSCRCILVNPQQK